MAIENELLERAKQAREQAYVPYSNFPVGAVFVGEDGEWYEGCNIENSSYGLSNCAERTAVFSALRTGMRSGKMVAVIADTKGPVAPCGACRQVLSEFLPKDARIVLGNLQGDIKVTTMEDLLPGAFGPEDL